CARHGPPYWYFDVW
nr:immunoglobulin heavy chain junction region [Mus musculus]MBK4185356.1 immunoglobulin heavy chain junction region [Mus musculus]MBK4185357.1 immunoglobulin heavy chain junction region [Mus musculus]